MRARCCTLGCGRDRLSAATSIPGGIDGLEAVFDDSCLVADGGLLLTGTVMHRLGLEAMVDETVRLDAGRVADWGRGRAARC